MEAGKRVEAEVAERAGGRKRRLVGVAGDGGDGGADEVQREPATVDRRRGGQGPAQGGGGDGGGGAVAVGGRDGLADRGD
ncbi:hypothetical protein VM98_35730, partial [Streptomyces rubellomurinus subsp. indigoferus]